MESSNKLTMAIITMVVGLVIGGGIGWAIGNMKPAEKMAASTTDSSAVNMADTDGVTVGGAKMVKTKDIVDNAAGASNVSTVVSLVKLADLVETLKSDGPFTVFGPNNDAFAKIDAATVADLQKPENKKALANILTYHVVSGTYTSAALKVMAKNGETLTTVQGQMLTPVLQDNELYIQDANGGKAKVQTSDVISSNGVTHVIESVLMPKS
jgi:uncharacterized surface protein with fasciclin (FAS1) repeats